MTFILIKKHQEGSMVASVSDDAYVRFDGVQKSYDGVNLVVKDLNIDIPRGEFLTLLGPSGSGKTTSLMMLAGFETATHGDIYIDGQSINNVAPHKRGIGMVFQNYALFPHMTVAENLAFPLQVRKMDKSEITKRVNVALDMVELGAFGNRRPAQLSGGQQQRVAVARALVFEPQLILMDEPLGALDKNLREQMQYEIKHIHERLGVTVVYVTHDQSEALTMSNRIAVFNDGRIQQLAPPTDLYEKPLNSFVAQFIGENNKLSGTITAVQDGLCDIKLESGEVVRALDVNTNGIGNQSTLSLRPERVFLTPDSGQCDNVFQGKVEEVIYLGDHVRVRMHVCGHSDFIVKVPNSSDKEGLATGETIAVGWSSKDCRALDAF
ncbi:MAG: putative spermidine/putrescine transport system ATP-binding protein [Motiliproteus sp.]|jgi:putative spermidine/putrescine transport system ATP-binding protein